MKKCVFLILAAIFLLLSSRGNTESSGTVGLKGDYPLEECSIKRARDLIKNNLMREAIEKVCGSDVIGATLIENNILIDDLIQAISNGQVDTFQVTRENTVSKMGSNGIKSDYLCIEAKVTVVCHENKRDPEFDIRAQLSKHTFEEGENLEIYIDSSIDCYVNVFSIYENGEIHLLMPNEAQKDNRVIGGKTFNIPKNDNYSIEVRTLDNRDECNEAVFIVATKEDIKIPSTAVADPVIKGDLIMSPEMERSRYIRWLSQIDTYDRVEALKVFSIHKKDKYY